MTTVFVCWLILFIFLRSKRVHGMLVAHCAVPVIVLVFVVLELLRSMNSMRDCAEAVQGASMALAFCCFVSSMVSFPASVLQMIVRALPSSAPTAI